MMGKFKTFKLLILLLLHYSFILLFRLAMVFFFPQYSIIPVFHCSNFSTIPLFLLFV